MAGAARKALERITLLGRALAVLIGAVVGAQVYARGGGVLAGSLAALAAGAVSYALLLLCVRRYLRWMASIEQDEPTVPPARRRPPKRSRRVLSDSDTKQP